MQLAETAGLNYNTLPYRVSSAGGALIPVHFEPLTQADHTELNGSRWNGSVFLPTWQSYIDESRTWKLVRTEGVDGSIEGLVRVGEVIVPNGALRNSLLESAPHNRYKANSLRLRGVGRTLIARLIVDGYNANGNGSVLVRAHPLSIGFYITTGFKPVSKISGKYLLSAADAARVFDLVTS